MNVKPLMTIRDSASGSFKPPVVHDIPISVILLNAIDYGKIRHLPANSDCTEILNTACIRILDRMFPAGASVDAFLRKKGDFTLQLQGEILAYRQGMWTPYPREEIKSRLTAQASRELRFEN